MLKPVFFLWIELLIMCVSQPAFASAADNLQDEFKLYSFLTTHVHVGKESLQDHFTKHPDHKGIVLLGYYEHKWSRFHLPNRAILLLRTNELVIAYGCTYSLRQYMTEFDIRHVPLPNGKGTVHAGFHKLYQSIRSPILADLARYLLHYKPERLTLSGFSLGGTGCILLLIELLSSRLGTLYTPLSRITVYTYGAPPVLDAIAANHLNELITQSLDDGVSVEMYRIIGQHDLVPYLIPKRIGFVHYDMPGRPYYIFHRDERDNFVTYPSTEAPIGTKEHCHKTISIWKQLMQWTNSHLYYTDITSVHWRFISSFRL